MLLETINQVVDEDFQATLEGGSGNVMRMGHVHE
jgi:hypothetical protein